MEQFPGWLVIFCEWKLAVVVNDQQTRHTTVYTVQSTPGIDTLAHGGAWLISSHLARP